MTSPRIHVGTIVGVHGVRGFIKVKSFMAVPQDITQYGPVTDGTGDRSFALQVKHFNKDVLVASLEGVDTREAAEALKGTQLYVSRDVLPEPDTDEFYHADLIDLEAVDQKGQLVGRVREVHDFGAGDFLVIYDREGGKEYTISFTKEAVPFVSLKEGRLVVNGDFLIDAQNGE